jgi:DNA-binding protein YbaB
VDHGEAIIAEELSNLGKLGERAKAMSEGLNALTVSNHGTTGLVHVVVGAGARLHELRIDPRAMRMDSESLAEEIVGAIDAATSTYEQKAMALVAELGDDLGLAGVFGPHHDEELTELTERGLQAALAESEQLMAQLRSRLRG